MLTLSNCVSQHRSIHTFDLRLQKCEQATYLGVRVKSLRFVWMRMGSNSKTCDSVKILRVKIAVDTIWILKFHKIPLTDSNPSCHDWKFSPFLAHLVVYYVPPICQAQSRWTSDIPQALSGDMEAPLLGLSLVETGGSAVQGVETLIVMNRCGQNNTFRFYMLSMHSKWSSCRW